MPRSHADSGHSTLRCRRAGQSIRIEAGVPIRQNSSVCLKILIAGPPSPLGASWY